MCVFIKVFTSTVDYRMNEKLFFSAHIQCLLVAWGRSREKKCEQHKSLNRNQQYNSRIVNWYFSECDKVIQQFTVYFSFSFAFKTHLLSTSSFETGLWVSNIKAWVIRQTCEPEMKWCKGATFIKSKYYYDYDDYCVIRSLVFINDLLM